MENGSAFLGLQKEGKIDSQGVFLGRDNGALDAPFLVPVVQAHLDAPRKFFFKGREIFYTNRELLGDTDSFSIVGSSLLPEFLSNHLETLLPWIGEYLPEEKKQTLFQKREDIDHRCQLLTNIDDLYRQTNRIIDCLQEKAAGLGNIKEEGGLSKLGATKPGDHDYQVMAGVEDHLSGIRQEFVFHLFDLMNPYLSSADNLRLDVFLDKGKVEKVFLAAATRPWEEAVVHQLLKIFHLHHPENLNERAWLKVLGKTVKGWRCFPTKRGNPTGEETILRKLPHFWKAFLHFITENQVDDQHAFFLAAAHLQKLDGAGLETGPFQEKMCSYFQGKELLELSRLFHQLLARSPLRDCYEGLNQFDTGTFEGVTAEITEIDCKPFRKITEGDVCLFVPIVGNGTGLAVEEGNFLGLKILFHSGRYREMVRSFAKHYRNAKDKEWLDEFYQLYQKSGLFLAEMKNVNDDRLILAFAGFHLRGKYPEEALFLWRSLPEKVKEKEWFPFVKTLAVKDSHAALQEFNRRVESQDLEEKINYFVDALFLFRRERHVLIPPLIKILDKKKLKLSPENKKRLKQLAEEVDEETLPFLHLIEILSRKQVYLLKDHQQRITQLFLKTLNGKEAEMNEVLKFGDKIHLLKGNERLLPIYLKHLKGLNSSLQKKVVRLSGEIEMDKEARSVMINYYQGKIRSNGSSSLFKEIDQANALEERDKISLYLSGLKHKNDKTPLLSFLTKRHDGFSRDQIVLLGKTHLLEDLAQCNEISKHERLFPLYRLLSEVYSKKLFQQLTALLIHYLENLDKAHSLRCLDLMERVFADALPFEKEGLKTLIEKDGFKHAKSFLAKAGWGSEKSLSLSVFFNEALFGLEKNLPDLMDVAETFPQVEFDDSYLIQTLTFHLNLGKITLGDLQRICRCFFRANQVEVNHWRMLLHAIYQLAGDPEKTETRLFACFYWDLVMEMLPKRHPHLIHPELFEPFMSCAIWLIRKVDVRKLFEIYRMKNFPMVEIDEEIRRDLVDCLRLSILEGICCLEGAEEKGKALNTLIIASRMFIFYGNKTEAEYFKSVPQEIGEELAKKTLQFEIQCFSMALLLFKGTKYEEKRGQIIKFLSQHLGEIPIEMLDEETLRILFKNLLSAKDLKTLTTVLNQLVMILERQIQKNAVALTLEDKVDILKLMPYMNFHSVGVCEDKVEPICIFAETVIQSFYEPIFERFSNSTNDEDFQLMEAEEELLKYGMLYLSNCIKMIPERGQEYFDSLFCNTPIRLFYPKFFTLPFFELNKLEGMGPLWYLRTAQTDLFSEIPFSIHQQIMRSGGLDHTEHLLPLTFSPSYTVDEVTALLEHGLSTNPHSFEAVLNRFLDLCEENPAYHKGSLKIFSKAPYQEISTIEKRLFERCRSLIQQIRTDIKEEWVSAIIKEEGGHLRSWLRESIRQEDISVLIDTAFALCRKINQQGRGSAIGSAYRTAEVLLDIRNEADNPERYIKWFELGLNQLSLDITMMHSQRKKTEIPLNAACVVFHELWKCFEGGKAPMMNAIFQEVSLNLFLTTLTPVFRYYPLLYESALLLMLKAVHNSDAERKELLVQRFLHYIDSMKKQGKKLKCLKTSLEMIEEEQTGFESLINQFNAAIENLG